VWNWEEGGKKKKRSIKLKEKNSNILVSMQCMKIRIELINRA
jgi:hypothetical protein